MLTATEIERIRRFGHSRSYAAGEALVNAGEVGHGQIVVIAGEVTVLDWGIAVATRETGGGLPLASTVTELAGTPSYMAPEMLGKEPSHEVLQTLIRKGTNFSGKSARSTGVSPMTV